MTATLTPTPAAFEIWELQFPNGRRSRRRLRPGLR